MKKFNTVFWCLLLFAGIATAQDAPTMFAMYEDRVMPSKNAEYLEAVKKFKTACEQSKVETGWTTISSDDNTYVHQVAIKNYADLDKNWFAALDAKLGKDAVGALWNAMEVCIESHDSYVMVRMANSSYLKSTPEDAFRDVTFWSVLPGKTAEAEKIIAEWKQLNEVKKTPGGFIAFRFIFGRDQEFAIVGWGKNQVDYATKEQKSNELLGDEGSKLWAKTLAITKKVYSKKGWIRSELSYAPPTGGTN